MSGQEKTEANANDPYLEEQKRLKKEQEEKKRRISSDDLLICRICFDGQSDETWNKLCSPCRCKGSMKYVHTSCLAKWRSLSTGPESLVKCDQCKTPYRFRKSRFIGMITNKYVLFILTSLTFISMVWTAGAILDYFIERSEARSSPPARSRTTQESIPRDVATQDQKPGFMSRIWNSLDYDAVDNEYYYTEDCYWGGCGVQDYAGLKGLVRVAGRLGSDNLNVISSAVQKFIPTPEEPPEESGLEWEEVWVDILESTKDGKKKFSEEFRENGWWENLVWEWKFGMGGIHEEEHDALVQEVIRSERAAQQVANTAKQEKTINQSQETEEKQEEDQFKIVGTTKRKIQRAKQASTWRSTWFRKFTKQISLGMSVVGIASLPFTSLGSFFNWGLSRSLLRRSRRNRNEDTSISTVTAALLVLAIVIGVSFTFYKVFLWVESKARRALSRAEDMVLDWQEG